jgi:hypothetical protein
MKKQTLRAVTMLVSIIALAFATALISSAQTPGRNLRAQIPFDFVVGDKTLAAGRYSVGLISTDSADAIFVRSHDGARNVIRLTSSVSTGARKRRTMLTFLRYGDTYYLSQVWIAGSSEGREMLKSKAERTAERELARNSPESDLAKHDSRPQIVTIAADLE